MSQKDCLAKFVSKINTTEIFGIADQYQQEGQSETEAMLSAVKEKIDSLKTEQRKIVKLVRAAYEGDGGTKPAKVEKPTGPVQGAIGMKLEAGQVVLTASGRETTPFPGFKTKTGKTTAAHLKKVDAWLTGNAHAEAVSRGDDFNARSFKDIDKASQSDKDAAEEYLFGEQPAVIKSILKPLVTPGKQSTYINGDRAEYTGKTETISGALFHEVLFTEGAREGKTGVTQRAPDGTNPGQRSNEKSSGILTPQISGNPAQFIKIAADSIAKLKTADVDRVLNETPRHFRDEVARYITDNRPDLIQEVHDVQDELKAQAKPAEPDMSAELDELKGLLDDFDSGSFSLPSKGDGKPQLTPEQEEKLLPIVIKLMTKAFDAGYTKFKDAAKYVLDRVSALGQKFADAISLETLQGAYIHLSGKRPQAERMMAVAKVSDRADIENHTAQNDNAPKDGQDVSSSDEVLERDSADGSSEPTVGDGVQAGPRGNDFSTGRSTSADGVPRRTRPGNSRVDAGVPAAAGEQGNIPVHPEYGPDVTAERDARTDNGERSGDDGVNGISVDPIPADAVSATATTLADTTRDREAQLKGDKSEVVVGNIESIRATLPLLNEGQQDDVKTAEDRHAKPTGYGMLFTNGTGTGKTYLGLGIIKRMEMQGKSNILIAAPSDKIITDWIRTANVLGLKITQLGDKKDAGSGIVITTYANMGNNDQLATRKWDMVVQDEAHYLMSGKDANETNALTVLRAISGHPDGAFTRYEMLNRKDIARATELSKEMSANDRIRNNADTMDAMRDSLEAENKKMMAEWTPLTKKLDESKKAIKEETSANQGAARTRATFLSATPFARESSLHWANGYLFDYKEGYPHTETSLGYNTPNPKEYFFITHLGYRKSHGKLTQPDAKVDSALMQRSLNKWMRKQGSVASRMLEVEPDYDRRFILTPSAIGRTIDEALEWIDDKAREEHQANRDKNKDPKVSGFHQAGGYAALQSAINDSFNYLSRRYVLEAIKAREVIPIVQAHIAMGRKVVVFHDYIKGGGVNPFAVDSVALPAGQEDDSDNSPWRRAGEINAAINEFNKQFPTLLTDLNGLESPVELFKKHIPEASIINGAVKSADKVIPKLYDKFQDESSDPHALLVQSDRNAGWSGHDTTGKNQRVLINIGQPTAPTKAIQQEGRIYRTGQASNAIMRYLNTGSKWEMWAFASTIATRASEAENLGMGEDARALKDAFIGAFEESDEYAPGHEGEGTGGKERDRALNNTLSDWDRAKTNYWAQQKKTSKNKAEEGVDYFATPEPIGLKMVEWLGLTGGESSLEPSAGHGAIARWLPENTKRTAIEPSRALRARLAMVMLPEEDTLIDGKFEDHNIVNKYHGIAMNPPFGSGGRTAIDHVAKAATHLRDGGRIVALIPTGPAADAKWEKWFHGTEEKAVKPLFEHPTHGPVYAGDIVKTKLSFAAEGKVSKAEGSGLWINTGGGINKLVGQDTITAVNHTGKRSTTYSPAADLHMIASIELPSHTFERAGTAVMTRIVVIEKQSDPANAPASDLHSRDLTNTKDIAELFDRLENAVMPNRMATKEQQVEKEATEKAEEAAAAKEEKKNAPKAEKPAKAAKSSGLAVGDTIRLDEDYKVEIYTTQSTGKEKPGIFVKSEALARKYSDRVFKVNGKGYFIGSFWLDKAGVKAVDDIDGGAFARRAASEVAPVSRDPAKTPLYEAFRQLSRFDETFQTNISYANDLETIAKEMTSDMKDAPAFTVEKGTAMQKDKRVKTISLRVTLLNGDSVKLLDIFDHDTARPYVVIGNGEAGQGVGGATAYQMAFAWAHNNGKTMKPDPAGLTVINRLRRSEAMISSALHFGTIKHLEPHRDQYVALLKSATEGQTEPDGTTEWSHPDTFNELEALKTSLWQKGEDANTIASNVNALVTASSQLAVQREPKLRLFEVADGVLRLRADKQNQVPLADAPLNETAGEVRILGVVLRPGSSGVGGTTLKRTAVSFSVQRALERGKAGVGGREQAAGNRSPAALALDAIRKTLGKLDSGTPEALVGSQYARGPKTAGMTVTAVQAAIDKLTAKDQNGPKVHVVQSTTDLPVPAPTDAKGFYRKGEVWIVADNNGSFNEVGSTYAHEAIAHYGLRNMLGREDFEKLVEHIQLAVKSGNKALAAISKSIRKTYVDADGNFNLTRLAEADEIAARVVENCIDPATGTFAPGFGFMKSVFAKVMAFLRSKGITIPFTHTELQGILVQSMKNIETGQKTQGGGSMAVAYSLLTDYTPEEIKAKQEKEAAALKKAQEDQRMKPVSQRKVTADQVDLFNPQESLFSIGTSKFKKWFGDSKVVNSDGKPLVVYHGTTADFARFRTGRGDFGDGIYATSDSAEAGDYATGWNPMQAKDGANVLPVYVAMQNPYYTTPEDRQRDGDEIRSKAEKRGHDGIIRTWKNSDQIHVIAFRPEQIKSAIGNNGDFDPSNPDIAFARKYIAGETTRQYTQDQLDAMDNVGFRTDVPSLKQQLADFTDRLGMRLKQGIFDQFAPIAELGHKAYTLMRQSKTASGAFEVLLMGGMLRLTDNVYDYDDQNKGGFLDRFLLPLAGEHHDFMRWVAANRAERLMGEGKERLFTPQDIVSLKTLSSGTTSYDYTLQHGPNKGTVTNDREKIYADSLKTFNLFMKNVLDMAEQSGLIDPESREIWEHDFYVPFYRVNDPEEGGIRGANVKGGVVRQEAFKTLKGGKNALNADLLENTLMNWAHLLDASAKNRGAQAAISAAVAAGIAQRVPEGTKKSVWVRVAGEKEHYEVSDPLVMEAISALEYTVKQNLFMNALTSTKHVLTVAVTASPHFKIKNLMRDSLQAISVSSLSGNVAGNVARGWKLSNPKSDSHFRLLAGGGTIHFGTMLEGSESKRVQALVESGVGKNTILLNQNAIKAFYRKVIEPGLTAYNELGNRSEEVNRASLYDQLRKQGMDHAEASFQARDLMDFSMNGTFWAVRFLTQVVPFMNAKLQGMYKLGKGAKEDPAKFAIVVGSIALASLALLGAYHDDEDWKKREDWDRNNFWWFKVGGLAYRIPKPFEIGAMATLAERSFELAFSKEMTNKRFMEQLATLMGDNLSMNPTPQLIKPAVESMFNFDTFRDQPIESAGMEKLEAQYRFNSGTSMTARGVSSGIAAVTGGTTISPARIDHLVKGYFAWLGTMVLTASDMVVRPLTNQPVQPKGDMWKSLTGGMVSELADAPSRYITQMYKQAKEVQEAYSTYMSLEKTEQGKEAGIHRDKNIDKLRASDTYGDIKGALADINEEIRRIERGTDTAVQKRDRIRELRAEKDRIARFAPAI